MNWPPASIYVSYVRLLSLQGKKEFGWWLKRENPELFALYEKELMRGSANRAGNTDTEGQRGETTGTDGGRG